MTDREVMQMALDALAKIQTCLDRANEVGKISDTIWMTDHETLWDFIDNQIKTLRTTLVQPEKEWVGLMESERIDILDAELTTQTTEHFALAQAIESMLKDKNT